MFEMTLKTRVTSILPYSQKNFNWVWLVLSLQFNRIFRIEMICIVRYLMSLTLLHCTISLTYGSSGDRSMRFQRCLTHCFGQCNHSNSYPGTLSLYLVLFGWQCSDECKYTCMHQVTQHAVARGWKIEQFYGKVSLIYLLYLSGQLFQPSSALNYLTQCRLHRKKENWSGWKKVLESGAINVAHRLGSLTPSSNCTRCYLSRDKHATLD